MDTRTYTYVTAIAKYQNLTKAAAALYVGQPTLSKFLVSLEEELGLKLFRKVGNKYLLTYAGERFVGKAEEILKLQGELSSEMADIRRDEYGALNIAFANMRCSYMVPETLPVFRQKFPNVLINLYEGHSAANDRRLLEGEIDVAFYTRPSDIHPLIEYRPLAREELLICTSPGHPIGQFAEPNPEGRFPLLDLHRLEDVRVLMLKPEQRTRQIVDDLLHENGIQLKDVFSISSIPACIGLASAGFGVSFVFEPHLAHRIDNCPIECYSIKNGRVYSDFVAAVRKGSYLSRYTEEYIKIVQAAAQQKDR